MAIQQIQFRQDESIRWAELNPVLAAGEPGYEVDTGKLKIGDGEKAWRDLEYKAEDGPPGPPGTDGQDGQDGQDGDQGIQGIQGIQGVQGPPGPEGQEGPVGPVGPEGPTTGINLLGTVSTWPPSANPADGDLWVLGDPVPSGSPDGSKPGDGVIYESTTSEWINTGPLRGPTGPVGPAGPAGPQGLTGSQGPAGVDGVDGVDGQPIMPTLTIGTVTEGSPAFAEIVGTPPDFILNLVLPAAGSGGGGTLLQIIQHPQDTTAAEGSTITLSVRAQSADTPPDIFYQWQIWDTASSAWDDLPGEVSDDLTWTAYPGTDGRSYRCKVSTANSTLYSNAATTTVTTAPAPGGDWTGYHLAVFSGGGPVAYTGGNVLHCLPGATQDGETWQNLGVGALSGKKPVWGNGFFHTSHYMSPGGGSWQPSQPPGTSGPAECWAFGNDATGGMSYFMGSFYTPEVRRGGLIVSPEERDIYKTHDGYAWEKVPITEPGNDKFKFIRNAKFVSTGNMWVGAMALVRQGMGLFDSFIYSLDGQNWEQSGVDLPNGFDGPSKVCFAVKPGPPTVIVAIRPGIFAWVSTNGYNWQQVGLPTSADWIDIHYGKDRDGNDLFMAVANAARAVVKTTDGMTWTTGILPENGNWDSVAYFPTNSTWYAHKIIKTPEKFSMARSG